MPYRYRQDILDELLHHGIRPRDTTPPHLVKEFVNDLYRYELRRLRARLVRREFPKSEYSERVIDLRRRYVLLSVPLPLWTVA